MGAGRAVRRRLESTSSLDAVEQFPLSLVLSPQGHLRVDMHADAGVPRRSRRSPISSRAATVTVCFAWARQRPRSRCPACSVSGATSAEHSSSGCVPPRTSRSFERRSTSRFRQTSCRRWRRGATDAGWRIPDDRGSLAELYARMTSAVQHELAAIGRARSKRSCGARARPGISSGASAFTSPRTRTIPRRRSPSSRPTRRGCRRKAQGAAPSARRRRCREYAGARNKPALLALLQPVQRAAQMSVVGEGWWTAARVPDARLDAAGGASIPVGCAAVRSGRPGRADAGVVAREASAARPRCKVTSGKKPGKRGSGADAHARFLDRGHARGRGAHRARDARDPRRHRRPGAGARPLGGDRSRSAASGARSLVGLRSARMPKAASRSSKG